MKTFANSVVVVGVIGAIVLVVVFLLQGNPDYQNSLKEKQVESLPEPSGYVMDLAGVLSAQTKSTLEADLKAFDSKAQIAVLTVKTTQPLNIENYAIRLAEKWAPGYKGKDNGIILIVATEDRKIRIEVGRGLEGDLTDTSAGHIISEDIAPHFKQGNWDAGVLAGVNKIKSYIK